MPSTSHHQSPSTSRGGGRVASDRYRHTLAQCNDFLGLEEEIDRYDLLLLVKRVGKLAGFSPRMIQLLDYYLAFTRDVDWEEGSRPIIYQSLSRTALDLGVSERQIQKLEQQLFEIGALTWHDSGNHRRFGQRDVETGRIVYAFGVELTPLAYLREELRQKLQEKRLYDDAWMDNKRQISWYRRQIRALLTEWGLEEGVFAGAIAAYEERYNEIAMQLRTHLDLETLRSLLARHKSLHSDLMAEMGVGDCPIEQPPHLVPIAAKTRNRSPRNEPKFVHYKSTTQESTDKSDGSPPDNCFQESVAAGPVPNDPVTGSGVTHVSLRMAVAAASERLQMFLPSDPAWRDLIEAAYRLRPNLGISQSSWSDACQLLGRTGAALCLLVTDRGIERPDDPVRQPAAYFRAMVNRARAGELRLHSSMFGLLQCHLDDENA